MGAIAGKPVDAAPDEEVSVQFPGQAEQLPDIALTAGDMNTARRVAQQFGGLAQVFQPAHALLALDRHARWIDPPPEGVRTLELLPGPELGRGHSQRQPVRRRRHARMINSPQTVCMRSLPDLSLPLLTFVVKPTASGRVRFQENSVVS